MRKVANIYSFAYLHTWQDKKKEFKIIAIASSKQSIYILLFYSRVEETEPQRHKNLSKDVLC